MNLYDGMFRLQKDAAGKVIKAYDYPVYFKNVKPENLPADGGKATLWSTPISQSINPGWVILLTPLVLAFFAFLRRKIKNHLPQQKLRLDYLSLPYLFW